MECVCTGHTTGKHTGGEEEEEDTRVSGCENVVCMCVYIVLCINVVHSRIACGWRPEHSTCTYGEQVEGREVGLLEIDAAIHKEEEGRRKTEVFGVFLCACACACVCVVCAHRPRPDHHIFIAGIPIYIYNKNKLFSSSCHHQPHSFA